MGTNGFGKAVQNTRELARVLSLPRRSWTEDSASVVAAEMTALLRKPGGSMDLRPIQGQALLDMGTRGGFFGAPIRVGGGKTLISLLAPFILESRRPLIVIPAKLLEKTKRAWRLLAKHWPIPNFIRFVSYEWLGRVQAQTFLEREYQPDLIVLDEAHKVKNRKAAVTKRLERYFNARPETKCVAMSGTMVKKSIKDWAHIARWCLTPNGAPVPVSLSELEDWGDALDDKREGETRLGVGFLSLLMNAEERANPSPLEGARQAFGRRLVETPGVVATSSASLGCSLQISAFEVDMRKDIDEAFNMLRSTWTTPDGWPLTDPLQVWRVARELSVGFYSRWEPRPPDDWMTARRGWSKVCRDILNHNRRQLDSLLMVTRAIDAGHYPEATPALEAWRGIESTFTPNPVPVWIDDSILKAAAHWAIERPGIIWCEHVPFANRLANLTNLAYYGRKGRSKDGRFIDDHPFGESIIASVASNAEGRDLQFKWSRNLITSCPQNGLIWEQIMGRTHRDGQEADEVEFDVVVSTIEHVIAFSKACLNAAYIQTMTPQPQKLLYADIVFPTPDDVMTRPGFRWKK